jgi:hypothetical protein
VQLTAAKKLKIPGLLACRNNGAAEPARPPAAKVRGFSASKISRGR